MDQTWDLWFPHAGATGISFARTTVEAADVRGRLLVHAAPPVLEVTVRDSQGAVVARGSELERGEEGPMSFLVLQDDRVELEDGWPTDDDLGRLVILPGGETGVLRAWWNAEDRGAWRWSVEFTNSV